MIGLSLLLMVMVFRSILLPVVATLGFIGSFAAAVGIVVAVFQWGWFGDLFSFGRPGPILTFLPVLMVGVLFGLAMDYQLFTASGMREAYVHGSAPRLAVRQGLHAGRSVVTAAALIMASVFAGFIFTPDPMVASIGLGLAAGVLLDASWCACCWSRRSCTCWGLRLVAAEVAGQDPARRRRGGSRPGTSGGRG